MAKGIIQYTKDIINDSIIGTKTTYSSKKIEELLKSNSNELIKTDNLLTEKDIGKVQTVTIEQLMNPVLVINNNAITDTTKLWLQSSDLGVASISVGQTINVQKYDTATTSWVADTITISENDIIKNENVGANNLYIKLSMSGNTPMEVSINQIVYDTNEIVGKVNEIDNNNVKVETIHANTSGGSGDAVLTENITSNVLVGAAPANTLFKKDTTFTEFAKKILLKEIAPTITFNATNSGLKEVGTSVSGSTLTTNITSLGTGVVTKIEFYEGSNLLDTQSYVSGTNSYSFSYTSTITSNTTFKTIVYYTKADGTNSTINQTKSITFVYASYYGAVSTLTPVEADIIALTKSIKNTKAFTWNNITLTDERFCYAYPKSFGTLTSIKDANNFEYIGSYTMSTIQIDSIDYYLYVLTDPTTGSGFKQIYS